MRDLELCFQNVRASEESTLETKSFIQWEFWCHEKHNDPRTSAEGVRKETDGDAKYVIYQLYIFPLHLAHSHVYGK